MSPTYTGRITAGEATHSNVKFTQKYTFLYTQNNFNQVSFYHVAKSS
jgi:hypothetical protein